MTMSVPIKWVRKTLDQHSHLLITHFTKITPVLFTNQKNIQTSSSAQRINCFHTHILVARQH